MKKRINFTLIFSTLLCLVPIILAISLYDKLPERVATHWDMSGNPNGYSSKVFASFILPAIMAIVNIIVYIFMENDPKKQQYPTVIKQLLIWIVPFSSVVLGTMTLFIAVGVNINISTYTPIIVGLIIAICGNYLPKIPQNYIVGIKLPWTLHSEENWKKTHHIAGYLWVIGGILIIINSFLLFRGGLIIISLLIIIPAVYSFYLYKKGI